MSTDEYLLLRITDKFNADKSQHRYIKQISQVPVFFLFPETIHTLRWSLTQNVIRL
jgi:hypothetical protein